MLTRTRAYRGGVLVAEGFPVGEISRHIADQSSIVWLDMYRPNPSEFAILEDHFDIHELALEDIAHHGQRPKIDHYRSHLFLSAYSVVVGVAPEEFTFSEIAVLLTSQAIITIRKDEGFDMGGVVARWDENPQGTVHGVGFLLHGLLDHLVDGHFAAAQQLDDSIEELESLVFEASHRKIEAVQRMTFSLRKVLVRLRRVIMPMREVVNTLMRPSLHIVNEPLAPYYQDVYDHVLRASEWTESLRDMVTSVVETNLAVQANRMNLIMKKVTSWAAIIAVPSAITGFYGQNLPFPGSGQDSGFVTSILVIATVSLVLYLMFKRRDWI